MENKYLELLKSVVGEDVKVLSTLVGGMMNEAYIVESSKGKFVYYISTEQANEMVDRNLEKETQKIVYDLGITSENIYFDLEKGIKINRFIEGNSLNNINEFDYKKVAKLMAKLHGSTKLASVYYDPFRRLEEFKKEAESHIDKFDPKFYELYDLLMQNKEYLMKQKLTLAHNDAQRSNIVKDPDDNYFFIDFEFAANNDPLYDIGTFGNGDVMEGKRLLEEYEKLVEVEDGLKRYALWRIDISLQWHTVAIIKHYRGEGEKMGFNFLDVASHFLSNAVAARELLK